MVVPISAVPVLHVDVTLRGPAGAEMDPLAAATREINPNANDISNQQSAGALLDQPVGLAYISSGPLFERNGPIR